MATPAVGAAANGAGCMVWPKDDMYRLLCMIQTESAARLLSACPALAHDLGAPVALMRQADASPGAHAHALEAQQAMATLDIALGECASASGAEAAPLPTWNGAWEELRTMEAALHTEMRYVYGPDWEVKPGKLVSKKGTWLKTTTQFSWEVSDMNKMYIPQGIVMPVLQIGQVTDQVELKRHEWGAQHLRVWLKPPIARTLEARRGTWFVYWPHFEDEGLHIVAAVDTWLKRTTQMSGELQPFELIYIPRGMTIRLTREPEQVEEQWEKFRHQHVHQHRKVVLAAPPLTVKQDKYDIFVCHSDERPHSGLR